MTDSKFTLSDLNPTSSGYTVSGTVGNYLQCNYAREFINKAPEFEFDIQLIDKDSSILLRISHESRVFIQIKNDIIDWNATGQSDDAKSNSTTQSSSVNVNKLEPALLTADSIRSLFVKGRKVEIRNGSINMARVMDDSYSMRACVDIWGMIILCIDQEEDKQLAEIQTDADSPALTNLSLIEYEQVNNNNTSDSKRKRNTRRDYRKIRKLHLYEIILSRMNVVTCIKLNLKSQPCEIGIKDFRAAVYLASLENPYMRSIFRSTDSGELRIHMLTKNVSLYRKIEKFVVEMDMNEEQQLSLDSVVSSRMKYLRNVPNDSPLSDTSQTLFSMDVLFNGDKLADVTHYCICQLNHGCMDARGNLGCIESVIAHLDRWLDVRVKLGLLRCSDCTSITTPLMLGQPRGCKPFIDILDRVTQMINRNQDSSPDTYDLSKILPQVCPLTYDKEKGVPFLEFPTISNKKAEEVASDADVVKNDESAKPSNDDDDSAPKFGELRALHWRLSKEQSERLIGCIKEQTATVQGLLSAVSAVAFLVLRKKLLELSDEKEEEKKDGDWVMRVQCPVQMSGRVEPKVADPLNCVCGSFAALWEISVVKDKTTVLELASECTKRMRNSIARNFPVSWLATMHGWIKTGVDGLPGYSLMSSNVGMNPMRNSKLKYAEMVDVVMQGGSFEGMIPSTGAGCMIHLHTFEDQICVNANYSSPGLPDELGALYSRIHREIFEKLAEDGAAQKYDGWLVSSAVNEYI